MLYNLILHLIKVVTDSGLVIFRHKRYYIRLPFNFLRLVITIPNTTAKMLHKDFPLTYSRRIIMI